MRQPKNNAAQKIFWRYIVTNILILIPPIIVAVLYFVVASNALYSAADAVAEVQLNSSVSYVDRKLSDLDKIVSQLLVDYKVNKYLSAGKEIDPIEQYGKKDIADRLLTIVQSGEFLNRCMLYLYSTDSIIYESGFADYTTFYGPLLEVDSFNASDWRDYVLNAPPGYMSFHPGFMASSGGRLSETHFLIRPIGHADNIRGAIIIMIDAAEFSRRLSRLPDLYGGWMLAFDERDTLLGSSPGSPEPDLIALVSDTKSGSSVQHKGERYRVYQQFSDHNAWRYAALMNESQITASAERIKSIAMFMLGAGFLVALLLSYGVASSNSKPIARLFSLVLPQHDSYSRASSAYERVEEAILQLSDSKRKLEEEVDSTLEVARIYFFNTLLRGEYHDRLRYMEDRKRFSVSLSVGSYYVIECRLPYLAAALVAEERNKLSELLRHTVHSYLESDEYEVIFSSGSLIVIKRALNVSRYLQDASVFINRIIGALDSSLGESVLFGVGTPVDDPFLLSLSFGEAEAALNVENTDPHQKIRFYESLPAPSDTYKYPLETESALIRASLSSNLVLLESLLSDIYKDNFVKRTLSVSESRFLIAALRGTLLRLMNNFSDTSSAFLETISSLGTSEKNPIDDYKEISAIFEKLAEEKQQKKKSHNAALASDIRKYVSDRFKDFNLSLTSISDAFNVSENYLSSFFKEQEGECLSEYIQRKRMTEASKLLLDSRESVDAIAANCGYSNGASFRRAFKRVYGLSPSDYRSRKEK